MANNNSELTPGYILRQRSGPPDDEACSRLAGELRIPRLLSVLLWQRGITSAGEAASFLKPRLADLPSPFFMKDMDRAAELVAEAVRAQWPICIHGDYDVDGVSSSALLALFFQNMGIRPICYQPDRLVDGYGVQAEFIRNNAPEKGRQSLLITVDCGISAVEEVRLAKELGFKVIITDHHETSPQLPEADAILNPKQPGCCFPSRDLAGVGVAFFLTLGIRSHLVEQGFITRDRAPNLKQFMDLVALGTVADVMPVTGINRILISAGLEVMNSQPRPWVSALKQLNGPREGVLTSEDISFRLAPRINAPGRMGKPQVAFNLLTCADPVQALALAGSVEAMNQERRQVENESLEFVTAACERLTAKGDQGLVVYGDFHPGVIGIIASRVAEKYRRPVFILTDDSSEENRIKGSGRSVDGVNLFEVLEVCADTIIQFGGHRMAAGLTVSKENLSIFAERFNEIISGKMVEVLGKREFLVDYCPRPEEVLDGQFLSYYQRLEPFGNGNPEPIFLLEKSRVTNPGIVKNHLKYSLEVNGRTYRAIGFGLAEKMQTLNMAEPVHLAVKIKNSVFRGVKRTELHTVEVFHPDELIGQG
ncbi:MAG: single-stranded-DNA-specific exonuclease RecJ [Desulfobulbaceae bacterium]